MNETWVGRECEAAVYMSERDIGSSILEYVASYYGEIVPAKLKGEHIGHVGKMSVSGYRDRRFIPWQHHYVVSLSKTLHPLQSKM